MNRQEVREPKQKRSIEKKQRIIKASYKLFCDKGFYKTNTVEIAQAAGVSTGIVYSYFQDKTDILIAVIEFYIASLLAQFHPLLSAPIKQTALTGMIEQFIDISVASHTMNVEAHNEFLALALLEKDIYTLFNQFEEKLLAQLYELLAAAGVSEKKLLEKVRICYLIVEQVCHDYIQRRPSLGEFEITKSLTIHAILAVLEENEAKP